MSQAPVSSPPATLFPLRYYSSGSGSGSATAPERRFGFGFSGARTGASGSSAEESRRGWRRSRGSL